MLFQALCASKNVRATDRFEHMHPGAHKGAHNSFRPLFQLDVDIELMDSWALRFDEIRFFYNNSSNNGNGSGFASCQRFGLLEERICNG